MTGAFSCPSARLNQQRKKGSRGVHYCELPWIAMVATAVLWYEILQRTKLAVAWRLRKLEHNIYSMGGSNYTAHANLLKTKQFKSRLGSGRRSHARTASFYNFLNPALTLKRKRTIVIECFISIGVDGSFIKQLHKSDMTVSHGLYSVAN